MTSGEDDERASQDVLVISDAMGNLYLIRRQTLESGRIFAELKERVEQLMDDAEASAPAGAGGPYRVIRTIRVPQPSNPTQTIRETLRNL